MTMEKSTDTVGSPDGSTNMGLHNQQQSVHNVRQGGVRDGGLGHGLEHVIPTHSSVHSNPDINTVDTKRSYSMDVVDGLIGVSSPQTRLWGGINFEKKNSSIDKSKKTMISFNYIGMGHNEMRCRNPICDQACRNEYIPGSGVCRDTWRYVKIGKGHKEYSDRNYSNGNYDDK